MFGIDSSELMLIAVVALVVIGPKELPGLLRSWGKWMAQMRGMASEFRGHVDEMVRQSDLDEVKKQLTDSTGGFDLKSLDPTKEIKHHLNEGMAEGEKALADAKSSFDSASAQPVESASVADTLVEPDSAPQIAVEPAPEVVAEVTAEATVEPPPAAPEALAEVVHKPEGKPLEKSTSAAAD
jgi:sec-independent protein translocase protein TatB